MVCASGRAITLNTLPPLVLGMRRMHWRNVCDVMVDADMRPWVSP